MKKLTILVDLDSVLADLDAKWYPAWNAHAGDDLHPTRVFEWATHKFTKTKCMGIYDMLNPPGFFFDLDPIPGGIDAVRALHDDGHRIVIVTAAPSEAPTAAYDKKKWVHKHLPFINKKNVIVTEAKDVIRGDILIDDGPHNIEEFRKSNPNAFIATISYNYNKHVHRHCDFVADYNYQPGDFEMAWMGIVAAIRDWVDPRIKPENIDANGAPLE